MIVRTANGDNDWKHNWSAHQTFNQQWMKNDIVVLDILSVLTLRHPKNRYLSGVMTKTVFYALWCLPESWAARVKVV